MNYRNRIYASYSASRVGIDRISAEAEFDAWAAAALHRLRGWLPLDKRAACLDVGCGAGQGLHMLARAGYQNVMGVDVSAERVHAAESIGLRVELAEATRFLRDHPEAFDFITGFDVVEHFTKSELLEFMDALYGALRPGGRIVMQTPNADSPWGLGVRYGDLTHELAFSPCSLGSALELAGFKGFEARECGPYVHGVKSLVRALAWQVLRGLLIIWNLVEMGNAGSGVYTRVFIAKAEKPVSDTR